MVGQREDDVHCTDTGRHHAFGRHDERRVNWSKVLYASTISPNPLRSRSILLMNRRRHRESSRFLAKSHV